MQEKLICDVWASGSGKFRGEGHSLDREKGQDGLNFSHNYVLTFLLFMMKTVLI